MTTTARILFYGRLATRPAPVRPGAVTVVAEADAEVETPEGELQPMRLEVVAWGDAGRVLAALVEGDEVQIAGRLVWRREGGEAAGPGALSVVARSVIPARTLPGEVEELVWMERENEHDGA